VHFTFHTLRKMFASISSKLPKPQNVSSHRISQHVSDVVCIQTASKLVA